MAVAVMSMRVGGVDVLVETVQVAGSEPTGRLNKVHDRAAEAFERARRTIVAMASATVDIAGELAQKAAAPQAIEVEFGLKFSAQGNVIVAGGSGQASVTVRLTYPGAAAVPVAGGPSAAGG